MESIHYESVMFFTGQATSGLYYKTVWIGNLQEIDKFHNKLAYSGLDKHTSVNKQMLVYYEICRLLVRNVFIEQATRGLHCKTIRICNLQEIDKFHSKLASFILGNHTSLNKRIR